MTKTLISVAAAGALAAMMTGCSSDDSTVYYPTTTNGIQSATQAVDGYIYNAKAEAFWLGEDNKTMSAVTMEAVDTTTDVATNTVKLGDNTYKLPADTNSTVKNRIKFFKLSAKPSTVDGTIYTPATYVEASGVEGYDGNDTLFGGPLYTPANAAVSSPLTSLIYAANPALFGDENTAPTIAVDINETTLKALENNATVIAKNLGLGDVDLLTADPVALAEKNPTLRMVTALMINADANSANAILAATKPATTLAETMTLTADALSKASTPDTAAIALATDMAAQA
jgi:hypothetical protein